MQLLEVGSAAAAAVCLVLTVTTAASIWLSDARWLRLPRALPLMIWALVAGAAVALAVVARRRVRDRASIRSIARAAETERGLRRGMVVGALELDESHALERHAVAQARAQLVDGVAIAPAHRRRSVRRMLVAAAAAAASIALLAAARPRFHDGMDAVFTPISAWNGTLVPAMRFQAMPAELLRGRTLSVQVMAPGRRELIITSRETGRSERTDRVEVQNGEARLSLGPIAGALEIVASDGRRTISTTVTAVDRPFVSSPAIRAHYPAYLHRADEELSASQPVRVPRGATLRLIGRASVPLSQVRLLDGTIIAADLATRLHEYDGVLRADHDMRLRWEAISADGMQVETPELLVVDVGPDSAPAVFIDAPVQDSVLITSGAVDLAVRALDDHGVRSVRLVIERRGSQPVGRELLGAPSATWSGTARLDASTLALGEGESAAVHAEVLDDSPWLQRARSRTVIVRRASTTEQRLAARTAADSAVAQAQSLAAAERTLAQHTDEAARQATRSTPANGASPTAAGAPRAGDMSYENAERARALAQEQQAMGDRVERLRDATSALERQLTAAGAMDSSLARQLADAQALLRQAMTPQLAAQMQRLQGAAGRLDGAQSRDALRDMAQLQQRMRQQLEQSAEMLKRAAHEGAMQTLGDEAREVAQSQQTLADSSAPRPADGAAQQRALGDRAGQLRQQMAALQQRLARDHADAGSSRTGAASEHAGKSESAMRRDAANGAASEMQQAAKSMDDARAAQVKEWKQELTSQLDRSVQEMLQLSRQERALEQQARNGGAGADRRGAQSAIQQGLGSSSERLQGEGRKSALLSARSQRAVAEARAKVQEATARTSQTSAGTQEASALGDAADALTRAAAALARDRERANAAGSASGFSEMVQQLQEMAKQQGQIAGQAQSLLSLPGAAGTPAGQSQARSLARQQRQVADQLDDVGEAPGGERTAQLAQEARQLAEALDAGRLDGRTLARQQQLFRRMLDAGRSLEKEEREDTGRREAVSARAGAAFTPAGGTATGRAVNRFDPPTWAELRGLSPDERRAIMDYFARLNATPRP